MTIPLPSAGVIPKIALESVDWNKWVQTAINSIINGPLPGKLQDVFEQLLPRVAAFVFALWVRSQGIIGKAAGDAIDQVEREAGPALQKMAAAGLQDYFGVPVNPNELPLHAGFRGIEPLAGKLGDLIFRSMFEAFETPRELTPDVGFENAKRVLDFNLATALEGWMGGVLTSGYLSSFFPNWADLDDIIQQTMGFGRANRRIMAPILNALIVTPFTWKMNETFQPNIFNEQQAARALFRGEIGDEEYFTIMARLGWSRPRAASLKAVNARLLEKEDVLKGLELGAIKEQELFDLFTALGYPPDLAEVMRTVTIQDRMRSVFNALEAQARDMFRDGEIDETRFRSMMQLAQRSETETEAWLALATIEKGRRKPPEKKVRRITTGDMETAYKEALIPLTELSSYYVELGYPDRDRELLLQLVELERQKLIERRGPPPEEAAP